MDFVIFDTFSECCEQEVKSVYIFSVRAMIPSIWLKLFDYAVV